MNEQGRIRERESKTCEFIIGSNTPYHHSRKEKQQVVQDVYTGKWMEGVRCISNKFSTNQPTPYMCRSGSQVGVLP